MKRNHYFFRKTALILGFGLSSLGFAGGPWTLPKQSGFVQVQGVLPAYQYNKLLTGVAIRDFSSLNRHVFSSDFGIYAEYGLTDKLDVVTNLPFKYVATGDLTDSLYNSELLPEGSLFGLSNYALAFKYRVLNTKLKLAVSVQTRLNTVRKDLAKGLITGFDANAVGLVLHAGGNVSTKAYAFIEAGFHKYTNHFSDVFEAKIEYGRQWGKSFFISFNMDLRQSLKNGDYFESNLLQTGLYPNNQDWIAISGKIAYETTSGLGFNFGVPLVPIRFNNVGFNGTLAFGIYKKWG